MPLHIPPRRGPVFGFVVRNIDCTDDNSDWQVSLTPGLGFRYWRPIQLVFVHVSGAFNTAVTLGAYSAAAAGGTNLMAMTSGAPLTGAGTCLSINAAATTSVFDLQSGPPYARVGTANGAALVADAWMQIQIFD